MTHTVVHDRRSRATARGCWNGSGRRSVRQSRCCYLLLLVVVAALLAGCSTSRTFTGSPRTTIEQLLISQSIERSLADARLSLVPGTEVMVETATLSGDGAFANKVITGWLRKRGLLVKSSDAPYHIQVVLHGLGTEQLQSFFGIPPIQSSLIPVSLPELSFYKSVEEQGYARFHLEISDQKSGQLVEATDIYEGQVSYTRYTYLLVFSSTSTDIVPPPP